MKGYFNKSYQWFGSKFRLLEQMLAIVLYKEEYYELFLGSGALFLNRRKSPVEVICDADANIVTLWKVIADPVKSEEFKEIFMMLPANKEIFETFKKMKKQGFVGLRDVEVAVMTFYVIVYSFDANRCNMRYAGKTQYWSEIEEKAKRQLVNNWDVWCHRAAQAEIINENALEVLERVKDHENAMIVLDPPYVKELLGDYCKNLYEIEFSDEDQVRMLQLIQNAKANILVCGYRGGNLLYDQYLNKEHGWRCYVIHDRLNKACRTGDVKGFAKEYVWCNYDIPHAACRKMNTQDYALSEEEVALYQKSKSS
uniref:DNA adenine methylase n=1 Tax=Acetatifactor sp. TaxID=1872090 RepID=UPI0040577DB6